MKRVGQAIKSQGPFLKNPLKAKPRPQRLKDLQIVWKGVQNYPKGLYVFYCFPRLHAFTAMYGEELLNQNPSSTNQLVATSQKGPMRWQVVSGQQKG